LISRKSVIEIFVAASILIIARLVFDLASAAAYVYPELDFGQNGVAFFIFIVTVPCVLIFGLVRLFQRRILEGVALLIICYVPFSFNDAINRHFWKFQIHKSEYRSILLTDPGPLPKYRVFNWGNRNTQLMGGGVLIEGIVYDESDEIAQWSPEWIERDQTHLQKIGGSPSAPRIHRANRELCRLASTSITCPKNADRINRQARRIKP
jgi:hypothetical protein